MTIKQLAKELCKREGKKKQVDIAQMTEVLGHLADILFCMDDIEYIDTNEALQDLGEKRFLRAEMLARKKK